MEYKRLNECAYYRNERTGQIDFDTYITTENMMPNRGGIGTTDTLPDAKTVSKYLPNDILLSNIRPYYKKIWFADHAGGCSNDVLVIAAKQDTTDARFLYYVLSDDNFFNYDTVTSKGTKMPRGTPNAIMKYLVPDIQIEKQKQIAAILFAFDSLIDNNNKRIKLLEQMAESLYKEWFIRFRFPGYETVELIDMMPKDWKLCKLGDFLLFGSGKVKPIEGNIYPVYGGNGITDLCDQYNYENIVIIGRVGAYSGSVYYESGKCWISDNALFAKRIKNDPISIYYDFYLLSSLNLNKFQGGTGQPLITQGMLSKVKIYLPTEELIRKFGLVIKPLFENIKILNTENENLIKQRNLLIPRLMSGKMEV